MSRSIFHFSIILLCFAASPGCAPLPQQDTSPILAHRTLFTAYTVAQLGFGNSARFGLCIPPACPTLTPKHARQAETKDPRELAGTLAGNEKAPREEGRRHTTPINVLTVYFPTGRSTLDSDARRSIDALVTSMTVQRVQIAARTDSIGTPAQNGHLVHRRAVAVARYLKAMPQLAGVPIDTEAQALCCYVASNGDAIGRRLNRRVDIALVPAEPEGAP